MNRTLWIHQLDQLHATLGSGADILPRIRAQGFTRLALKLLDGVDWMGEFDTDPYRLTSFGALAVWQAACNAAGLALDVWCNVTSQAAASEPGFYQTYLADFPGRLILDVEPYDGFWGPSPIDGFLVELRAALIGPTADSYYPPRVCLCYDPRRLDWIHPWLNQFGTHMPQIYSEYQIGASMVPVIGRPVEPVLSTGDVAANWRTILTDPVLGSEDGRTGYGVFRAPVMSPEQLSVIAELG